MSGASSPRELLRAFPGWSRGKDTLQLEMKAAQGSAVPGLCRCRVVEGDADVCWRCPLSCALPLLLLPCRALARFAESGLYVLQRREEAAMSYLWPRVLPHNC